MVVARATVVAALTACASMQSMEPRGIRAIRLNLPETRICPGQRIRPEYRAILDDGSSRVLQGSALALLGRRGEAAEPADDGDWSTDPDPFSSAVTGFRLSVWLLADPAVAAETTLAPVYSCSPRKFTFTGRGFGASGPDVSVRIAQMRSPFYDSVVVVAMEPANGLPARAMFLPDDLRAQRITVVSAASAGRAGASGRSGGSTPACSNGEDGGDGQGGQPGGDGGQFTVIADADQAWLHGVLELLTLGGAGGPGGAAGRGGAPGVRRVEPGTGVTCAQTRGGRNGRSGTPGAAGGAGGAPKRLDSELSLMWFGSQTYDDPRASRALAALLNLTLHQRP